MHLLDHLENIKRVLSGAYSTVQSHGATHTDVTVYMRRDYIFQVRVCDDNYVVTSADGTVLNRGTTFVEYAQFLKSKNMLASWVDA